MTVRRQPNSMRRALSDTLEDGVIALGAAADEGVPVLDEHDRLIGWVTHRRLLRAYLTRANGHAVLRT